MLIEDKIIKVATKVFQVESKDVRIDSRFKGGMSNYTYLVYVNDLPYVIRVIGDGGEVLVDPSVEKKHLQIIQSLHLNSEVVYLDTKTGVKVSKYVEGTPLSVSMTDDDYPRVASALRKLHQAKLPGEDYGLKTRLRHYEKLLKNAPSSNYYALKMQWLKMYDAYFVNLPKVLCHGDAQRSNLVKSDEQLYLLDWEFSGLNDPFYDIASFGNIDFKDAEKLLEFYLERKPTLIEIAHIRFYRMFQVLQWHIVATYKHEIELSKKLNLDFEMIAGKYLNLAAHFLDQIKDVEAFK
jgi:thiamine kinase-like enzyme